MEGQDEDGGGGYFRGVWLSWHGICGDLFCNLHCSLFGLFVLAMSNMAYDIGKLINLKLKM